jgi:hypothetical protein
VSISSDEDTDCTEKSDSEYDSVLDHDVDMRIEDDVDAPDGVDLDSDVDMERYGDDDEEEDEEEEGEEEEDEEMEDEEEDENKDDDKEPRTIGQGVMVNTSADDADIMVDGEPTVLPEQGQEMDQGQEMREHTPWLQPLAPATRPQTPEPPPRPQTPETHIHSGLEFLGLVTPQKPRPAAPTRREAEAAGNTSHVDVEQPLLAEWAGGDSHPDVPLPDIPLPDVPLPDVPLPHVHLPDV